MSNSLTVNITVDIGGVKYQYGAILNKDDLETISENRCDIDDSRESAIACFVEVAVLDSIRLCEKQISDMLKSAPSVN